MEEEIKENICIISGLKVLQQETILLVFCVIQIILNHWEIGIKYFKKYFLDSWLFFKTGSLESYELNVCIPPNSYVEILTPEVMV